MTARKYLGLTSGLPGVMEGLPSAARQLIFEGIFTARCRAARYLAYNFNDLPNNIAAVAAGGALEQIANRRADHCRRVGGIVKVRIKLV